jgi:multidrug efflux pump subunit AcrB
VQSDAPLEEMLGLRGAVVGAGWQSGKFLYVDTDLKIDKPEARVVIDRERSPTSDSTSPASAASSALLGGGYVNRFNYFDRSYKVIPQIGHGGSRDGRAAARPEDQDADRRARAGVDLHADRERAPRRAR